MIKLTKDDIERMCRAAGMMPAARAKVGRAEVFIADGASMPPHHAHRRFGIGPEQFPGGMWATMWWTSRGENKVDTGSFIYCDLFHDPQYAAEDKRRARINAALKDAKEFLGRRKKAMH